MIEQLYNQAIKEYNQYLDRVWDIYNYQQTGILPIRLWNKEHFELVGENMGDSIFIEGL